MGAMRLSRVASTHFHHLTQCQKKSLRHLRDRNLLPTAFTLQRREFQGQSMSSCSTIDSLVENYSDISGEAPQRTTDNADDRIDKCSGPEPSYTRPIGCLYYRHEEPFEVTGGMLKNLEVAYETWGQLNADRSNVILLQGGLSASSHAASTLKDPRRGWWEKFIGPGRALDTNRFFIICCCNLGSCYGTTGPSSLNPESQKPYALFFPRITLEDIVRTQLLVLDSLGIEQVHAVVGGSLGGMLSLCTAARYPDRVNRLVSLSGSGRCHPTSTAMRYVQRRALALDPDFNGGNYYDGNYPREGMRLAREIAMISYRSGPEWRKRFGQMKQPTTSLLEPEYEVERYLNHQGLSWCNVHDPNSNIVVGKAMDEFSLEVLDKTGSPSLVEGLRSVMMPTLIMGSRYDVLIPPEQQREVASALRIAGNSRVIAYELDSIFGHDTFLIDVLHVGGAVKGHVESGLYENMEEEKQRNWTLD